MVAVGDVAFFGAGSFLANFTVPEVPRWMLACAKKST